MSYKANHFVSKFQIKNWLDNYKGNSSLWVCDLEHKTISAHSQKRVFSKQRVFSSNFEKKYNELIETPLAIFLNESNFDRRDFSINWKQQRAIYLSILLQGHRVKQALFPEFKEFIAEEFLLSDQNILDYYASEMSKTSSIYVGGVSSQHGLCLPLVGYYIINLPDQVMPTLWSKGFVIPVSQTNAVIVCSNTVEQKDVSFDNIWPYSIVNKNFNKTILPPKLLRLKSRSEIFDIIEEADRMVAELDENIEASIRLSIQIANLMGFEVISEKGDLFDRTFTQIKY